MSDRESLGPTSYANTLVIGATGMMSGVALHLAKRSKRLVFTGHTKRSVDNLTNQLTPLTDSTGVQLDWNRRSEFINQLSRLCGQDGAPDLVVAWLHDDDLGPEILTSLAKGQDLEFYQVRGSAAANPSNRSALDISNVAGLHYHEIILGFVVLEHRSRWLTHEEICSGVLDAIECGSKETIVGTVEPWTNRP